MKFGLRSPEGGCRKSLKDVYKRQARMQETIKENYDRIKAEAAEIVDTELDRLRKDPVLCQLLPPEQGS